MRKANRQMDAEWALAGFDRAPYVTVSMTRPDGSPYGLPLSLVRTDDKTFYFHCASEGEKLDCIKANPIVSLSAVWRCHPVHEEETNNFTMYFDSAVAIGKAEIVDVREEKIKALHAICQRFLPTYMSDLDTAISRSLDRTTVVRITLTEPSIGKRKGYSD